MDTRWGPIQLIASAVLAGCWLWPAQATQVILNQPLSTVKAYLGPVLAEKDASTETGVPQSIQRDFDPRKLCALIPEISRETSLSVIFVKNRAKKITINPMDKCHLHPGQDAENCPSKEMGPYSEEMLAKMYIYLFGEQPTGFAPPPGWQEGGHEGFSEYGKCMGPGILVRYVDFYGIAQVSPLEFTYDPACKRS